MSDIVDVLEAWKAWHYRGTAVDLIVIVLTVLTYIFDLVKDFFGYVFTPTVLIILAISLNSVLDRWHTDQRLNRIEKMIADIQNSLFKRP